MADAPAEMSDVIAAFKADVDDSVAFIDSEIAPLREAATRYYNAEPFGDEEEGRSQIVVPVVRDTVRATLPSLMEVFFAGQRVCEFNGTNAMSGDIADEMTEAVHYVLMRQNPGFEIMWAAFKDALVRKVGWVEWYWDESVCVTAKVFTGCSEEQLLDIQSSLTPDEQLEVLEAEQVGVIPPQPIVDPATMQPAIDPATGQPAMSPPQPIHEFKIRLIERKKKKQVHLEAIPPEEVIVSRDARSPYTARLIGRRGMKTVGELRALGIPQELIDEASGSAELEFNTESRARNPGENTPTATLASTPDQKKIPFARCFYRVDADGDGYSELRLIFTIGANHLEVSNEYANEVQMAGFCPDPEPHTVWGLSQADNVADLQNINSHVMRDVLDSLKLSIFPRVVYVEGQANVDDVLNTEIGGAIRARSINAVTNLESTFVGQQAFGLIEYLDQQRESRTGLSKNAQGLDPRALQSTNQVAVAAAVTASQAQVKLIARIFAESGMTRLLRGIAKLIVENNVRRFDVPVRGELKQLNPQKWDVDAEMTVDSGLGVGSNDFKIAVLKDTAAAQTLALDKLGLENPLCSLDELYYSQKTILELSGFRNTHRFFTKPSEKAKTLEPKEPEPTPEQVLAQAQMQIEAGKLNVKRLELILTDDRERDKNEADVMLRAAELKATVGAQIDVAALRGAMDRRRDLDKAAAAAKSATS